MHAKEQHQVERLAFIDDRANHVSQRDLDILELRAAQISAFQLSIAQVGPRKIAVAEDHASQIAAIETGLLEGALLKPSRFEAAVPDAGQIQITTIHLQIFKIGIDQLDPEQAAIEEFISAQISFLQVATGEVRAFNPAVEQLGPKQLRGLQMEVTSHNLFEAKVFGLLAIELCIVPTLLEAVFFRGD